MARCQSRCCILLRTYARSRSVKPTMSTNTPTLNTPTYSRLIPGATLGVMLILLALHHWYAVTYKSVYPVVVLLLTLIAGFAAGGTVYAAISVRSKIGRAHV